MLCCIALLCSCPGRLGSCRDAFMAPEGRVLLSADYAQMELRLMAHLSGDESLCAVLADPDQDPFTQWAAQWLRVKPITAVCAHAYHLIRLNRALPGPRH